MNPATNLLIYLLGMLLSFIISMYFWIKHIWKYDFIAWTPNYFIHFLFSMFFIFFGSKVIEIRWKYGSHSHYMPDNSILEGLMCMVFPLLFMFFLTWIVGRHIIAQKNI